MKANSEQQNAAVAGTTLLLITWRVFPPLLTCRVGEIS